jgi:hypothetical protein
MDKMEYNIQKAIKDMIARAKHVNDKILITEETQRILHFKCEKYKIELEQSKERLKKIQNVK